MTTRALIEAYFAAFNAHDAEAMLALLADDVIHDINEGGREVGREAFGRFKAQMDTCYREQIRDMVVMVEGDRGCCDFICDGNYLATDGPLPEARGQRYSIPGCAIFHCEGGQIRQIVSYYNLREWIAQVS